jgi:hypothetical protein
MNMGKVLRYLHMLVVIACCGTLFISVPVKAEEGEEEILVGRIAHLQGKLLRYIDEEKDWVLTVKDSPFGLEDALYSGEDSSAEFIMPNGTWLRVGENTQIQLIALNADATTIDLASGLSRFYNKSADTLIKVTTPFGYVVAPGGSAFDLYVGDESLEVIAISGAVDFIHYGSKAKYQVRDRSSSIIAGEFETYRGNGAVDAEWDDWNAERDKVWDDRLRRSEYSAQFLPEALREESYALEDNGQWERVHYEGEYRDMWRPSRVDPDWRPFTTGRWTVYYGDNCWIPDEDFGYVTHHYGSWVYVDSFRAWYWMPPVARFVVDTPGIFIGFGWFPGRVGWIHSGPSIGWVPLAPREVYYGSRHWGHRTVVVKPSSGINININIGGYRYINDAVVVHRDHFYRGSRYTQVYERDISRDVIVNNYRPTTIINHTVINNINIDKRRYTYNDAEVIRKPHTTVINRINDNHRVSREFDRISRQRIERDVQRFQTRTEPSTRVEVARPSLVSKIVAVENIAKPIQTLALEEKELKPKRRERERPIRVDVEQRSKLVDKDGTGQKVDREKPQLRGPQDNLQRPDEGSRERQKGGKKNEEGLQQEQIVGEEIKPRPGLPQDKNEVEADLIRSPQERKQSAKEPQLRQEQKLPRQPDQSQRKPNVESFTRQDGELQGPRQQRQPSEESTTKKPQAEGVQPEPIGGEAEKKPRSKPPKAAAKQDAQVITPPQDKGRQVKEKEEKQHRQQVETQRQQEQDKQVQREQDQQRQQQEGRQVKEKEEKQRRQQMETQRQQEKDKQVQREQDQQRQQQEGRQVKEKEEKQRRQQVETQRRQEQDKQDKQVQREQNQQQRQLQEKPVLKELERKPQEEQQVQQKKEKKREQDVPAKSPEEQMPQEKKKNKKQQEEERLQRQQPTAKL